MTNIDILEELYNKLPNKEVDNIIDLILEGNPEGVNKAENYLNNTNTRHTYNLFQSIKEKPIYKTASKFINNELNDEVQILKMISSILTQIFIQCELRGLDPSNFKIDKLTDLINKITYYEYSEDIYNKLKDLIIELGFQDTGIE